MNNATGTVLHLSPGLLQSGRCCLWVELQRFSGAFRFASGRGADAVGFRVLFGSPFPCKSKSNSAMPERVDPAFDSALPAVASIPSSLGQSIWTPRRDLAAMRTRLPVLGCTPRVHLAAMGAVFV